MTTKNYIDEIKLRISRLVAGLDVNDYEIVDMLNNHRLAVQRTTMPYLYNRYGDILELPYNLGVQDLDMINQPYIPDLSYAIYRYPLPTNFIKPINLIVQIGDNVPFIRKQARNISEKEIYSILLNDWLTPTFDQPVYATKQWSVIPATNEPGDNELIVGFAYDPALGEPHTWDGYLQLWYVRALDMLDYDNDMENILSPDLQQLVILEVIKNILQELSPSTDLGMIRRDLQIAYQNLQQNYYIEEAMKVELLESNKQEGAV